MMYNKYTGGDSTLYKVHSVLSLCFIGFNDFFCCGLSFLSEIKSIEICIPIKPKKRSEKPTFQTVVFTKLVVLTIL